MDDNAELEYFRRKWREEVSSRQDRATGASASASQPATTSSAHQLHFPPTQHEAANRKEEEFDDGDHTGFDGLVQQTRQLSLHTAEDDSFQNSPQREPRSALEHFEKAVEKEAEGRLGDSLTHYRKAYRVNTLLSW
jgi:F-box protein 9